MLSSRHWEIQQKWSSSYGAYILVVVVVSIQVKLLVHCCFLMVSLTSQHHAIYPKCGAQLYSGHRTSSCCKHPQDTYILTLIFLTSYQSRPSPNKSCMNQLQTVNHPSGRLYAKFSQSSLCQSKLLRKMSPQRAKPQNYQGRRESRL